MLHVWNIYLHLPQKSPSFVGKYSSTMEHMGMLKPFFRGMDFPIPHFLGYLSWGSYRGTIRMETMVGLGSLW